MVGHKDIEAIVKTFGRTILDDAFAEAFDAETGAEREAARPSDGDTNDWHLPIGGGLAGTSAAFRAMAIGGDGVLPGVFGGADRHGQEDQQQNSL